MENTEVLSTTIIPIENRILNIRSNQVMLDRDLAELYGVETKSLNQAVKRNMERFPTSFAFRLTDDEFSELVTKCDRFKSLKHSSVMPLAFTEQGVSMLSAVLRSPMAVKVSIQIMDAFVAMRRVICSNSLWINRLDTIERRQFVMEDNIEKIFMTLEKTSERFPVEGVFYDGQIFDAYVFATDLIRSACTRLVLIDNYVDESVLLMLSKRSEGVSAEIRTGRLPQQFQLDLEKHNSQYAPISIVQSRNIHDRFLIVDDTVFHLGASLKDLGKKLFAFSKMSLPPSTIL